MQESRRIENIALIGFMGTGKTAVGHQLARRLHFQLVDTDVLIEQRAGKSVADIFRDDGEARFRQYERDVVAELSKCQHTVIATGGGLAVDPGNLASLKHHCLVVCLWASPDLIWRRVRHQTHRPLLHDPDPLAKIQRLLAERERFYRQADVLVNTNLRSIKAVTTHVLHHFQLFRQPRSHESPPPATGR